MIQRHLLMHVYNPSQFFRGRSPLISSSPYIPYAQLPAGMPGQRKRIFKRLIFIFMKQQSIFLISGGPEGTQGLTVCKYVSPNFLNRKVFISRVHKVTWVNMVCLEIEALQ